MKKVTMLLVVLLVLTTVGLASAVEKDYEDGTYRGVFVDGAEVQVNIQFTLKGNVIEDIRFRHLAYRGTDYRKDDNPVINGLLKQHEELIAYLVGKDIREHLKDLYTPGNIVSTEVDTFTGATLRGNKIISAMRDALNRGVYSY